MLPNVPYEHQSLQQLSFYLLLYSRCNFEIPFMMLPFSQFKQVLPTNQKTFAANKKVITPMNETAPAP
jgi:hypothetical protein